MKKKILLIKLILEDIRGNWGWDKDCPVFQRKECELQEENERQFRGVLSERK